ncbi:MAG: SpoIID/LytB domain-containing protein [Lachnospiraceae bacterium]|nr:SpoIID/LytB domain-containing protein [Lachnospiraceae bacterium]
MARRKWYGRILIFLQIVTAAGLAAAALFLLFRYAQYGQQEKEASGRSTKIQQKSREKRDETEGGEQDAPGIPDTIRVRILDQDFQHEYHTRVAVSCHEGFTVKKLSGDFTEETRTGREEKNTDAEEDADKENDMDAEEDADKNKDVAEKWCGTYSAEEVLEAEAGNLKQEDILCVEGENGAALVLESLRRGDGVPEYQGKLYLIGGAEGITVINELPLEEYLCSVVSSEMPSDYPKEALKAQAVCARTYAANCIKHQKDGAICEDLNDSVSFQVYNNYRCSENSRRAVEETAGEILPLEEVQYYSTSCLSEQREDLGTDEAFEKFLAEAPKEGAQYGSPWLRWRAKLSLDDVLENLRKEYHVLEGQKIEDITVEERRGDGQVQALAVTCGDQIFEIEGEYQIRKILGNMQLEIELLDGTVTSGMQLLPSAFFCLEKIEKGYAEIKGGGYGHGNGMSQCGAAEMADQGLDYRTILEYYYSVSVLKSSTR